MYRTRGHFWGDFVFWIVFCVMLFTRILGARFWQSKITMFFFGRPILKFWTPSFENFGLPHLKILDALIYMYLYMYMLSLFVLFAFFLIDAALCFCLLVECVFVRPCWLPAPNKPTTLTNKTQREYREPLYWGLGVSTCATWRTRASRAYWELLQEPLYRSLCI